MKSTPETSPRPEPWLDDDQQRAWRQVVGLFMTLPAAIDSDLQRNAGLNFYAVAWDTAIQDHVPHRVLARVASWDVLTSFLALPLGNALAGPVSIALGVNRTLVIGAGILLAASLAPLLVAGTRRLTRATPEVALPSNPVVEMQAT